MFQSPNGRCGRNLGCKCVFGNVHSGTSLVSIVGWIVVGLLITISGAGCKNGWGTFLKKPDNPVLGNVPERVEHVESDSETKVVDTDEPRDGGDKPLDDPNKPKAPNEAIPVNFVYKSDPWKDWKDDTAIFNSQVAAVVNGAPILNGEVLDRYSQLLITFREDMQRKRQPPEEYIKHRKMLVARDLPGHIQRKLLVERMKSSMKPDQIKQMHAYIDNMFEIEVEKLKRDLKVSSRPELELELNKKGTTLQNVKDGFASEQMAMGYFHSKLEKVKPVERYHIIEYYQAHPEEFSIPNRVEWEQIQVSFGPNVKKDDARLKVKKALNELQNNVPFEQVAKKYSDGRSAKTGGRWELMDEGTLADTKLEKQLFQMPIGELSDVYEGKSEFQIVRVLSREPAGKMPVGEVQDGIRKKLEDERNKNRPKKLLEQLMSEAVIETEYDLQQGAGPQP